MIHRHFLLCLALSPLLLGACQGYDVKINDRVVYTPAPLFADFEVADRALRDCLDATIANESITAATQLEALNCSSAGIESLAGLAVFGRLRAIVLSSNGISDVAELAELEGLQALYLADNQIVDPLPLGNLPALVHVDLTDNPTLRCPDGAELAHIATLLLPDHCN